MNQKVYLEEASFFSARPVWPENRELEKNLSVGFRTEFQRPKNRKVVLRIAASSIYRFFLNGEFHGHGPARGPHEYYRVDEWDLSAALTEGKNTIAIEVTGYNINSYYLLDQPSFLQAEVLADQEVLSSTSEHKTAFEATILTERVQKVQRYSFQRTFSEVYRLKPGYELWRCETSVPFESVACSGMPSKKLISRRIPVPQFTRRSPILELVKGRIETGKPYEPYWKDRSLTDIGQKLGGYKEEELGIIPSIELQGIFSNFRVDTHKAYSPDNKIRLEKNSYSILDFGVNLTGFPGGKITCYKDTRLLIVFDEILTRGDVDFKRLACVNIVSYEMQAGVYKVESFEPYTLRYLKLVVLRGECEVEEIYLREYANPEVWEASFKSGDTDLNCVFEAGRETFRQNAVDIFMDCPSRERAGWLCDSFFASRTAFHLSGNTVIEKNFFENYLLPEKFSYLPDGMLPMCYPADHNDGTFIPNWALWFVIELEEYLIRSSDRDVVDALKLKVLKLFDYFNSFKNEDGLLEKLDGWIFVDASKANELAMDVNYPTNMLYAGALSAAGRIYHLPGLIEEAGRIKDVIRKQSFNGEFFVDNAMRKDGRLEITDSRTEACQYYAFFLGIAKPETHRRLWVTLLEKFGPHRKDVNEFPDIYMANSFVGNCLRLEILSSFGHARQLLSELKQYFLYMVERTGTLWENDAEYGSCNHGFASHVVYSIFSGILGIFRIDTHKKVIKLRFTDVSLDWCKGQIPLGSSKVCLEWRKEGGTIYYNVSVPEDYQIEIENLSEKKLVEKKFIAEFHG